MKTPSYLSALLLVVGMAPGLSHAVNERKGGTWPWSETLHGHHDAELAEALGGGWFLNVGPTGIRAKIDRETPKYFTVKYVFRNSPADGLVQINDVIVGANGCRMNVAHEFGRHKGWEGPMIEMSKLIEDSQGQDGKLDLIIWPAGNQREEKTVTVQIRPVGRFSPTFPFNCPRSDRALTELRDWLVEDYQRAGTFDKPRPHTFSSCVLALMGTGESKYQRIVDDILKDYRHRRYDATKGVGFPAWGQVHDAIVMGEYYLLKGDKRLEPAMESLAECLKDSVWPTTGGLSHRPHAFIQRRMAAGGPKGYGAMALPAGLGMVGMSLFKEAGLPHGGPSYQRIHEAYLCSVSPSGQIGYGFNDWDHAVIEVKSEKAAPVPSPRGIGFECPDGMQQIGDYRIVWPTKSDPRYRPTGWINSETKTNRVFHKGGKLRLVVRNMSPDDPTRPLRYDGGNCDHFARSGAGALAHRIGNEDNKSWRYLSDLMAAGCANNPQNLLNGHASTHMHVLWGSLGAALADREDFQKYMDYNKWWLIMAQTHDGSYVVLPGRDYASTDHVYATRCFPTACAALMLSVKDKALRITGRRSSGNAPAGKGAFLSSSRPARQINEETRKALDEMLQVSLRELSNTGQLKPVPVSLSVARAKVWLSRVDTDMRLHFSALQGTSGASFAWDQLSKQDHALLAGLVARARVDDGMSQALAGVFMESAGNTKLADQYYEKAGPDFALKIQSIFQ